MYKVIIRALAFTFIVQALMSCEPSWVMRERKRRFKEQIGTYILSLERTDLGVYAKDADLYKNLTITFKPDSTIFFNMDVPFFRGKAGIWEASEGDPDFDINTLFFSNDKNLLDNIHHVGGHQLTPVRGDGFFQIHNAAPKKNMQSIPVIYFKRIKYKVR